MQLGYRDSRNHVRCQSSLARTRNTGKNSQHWPFTQTEGSGGVQTKGLNHIEPTG